RVGGRVWNHELGGGDVSERGGTFVGPTQDHILALAKAYGVDTFDTYDTGDNVYVRDGNRQTYSDTGPTGTAPPDGPMLADLATVVTRLDDMSTHVPVDAPWHADSAADWDGQTLETWIKANSVNPDFMKLVRAATRPLFGAEPRELPLPFRRAQLTQRLGQGALTKVAAVYDKPFWRDKGLNGTAVSTDGLVSATFDDSPNRANPPGVVFGFVGGDQCRAYAQLSDSDRRTKVLEQFQTFFGDEAINPTAFFDTLWAGEQWSRGCPVG